MNFKSIFKSLSIALLAVGMGQAAFAMEKSANNDLIIAITDRDLAGVQDALSRGADVNHFFIYGTPLHIASWNNHLEIIKLLLDYDADINCVDQNGETPLHNASLYNHPEIVKLLLDRGADINCINNYGETPLHYASLHNHLEEIVKLLLEHGADINLANNDGETALDIAKKGKRDEIIAIIEAESEKRKMQYAQIILARLLARPNDLTITNLLKLERK